MDRDYVMTFSNTFEGVKVIEIKKEKKTPHANFVSNRVGDVWR